LYPIVQFVLGIIISSQPIGNLQRFWTLNADNDRQTLLLIVSIEALINMDILLGA